MSLALQVVQSSPEQDREQRREQLRRRREKLQQEIDAIDAELTAAATVDTSPPTQVQQDVLDYVRAFQAREGHPPTFREMAEYFHISVTGVLCRLQGLAKKGLVAWTCRKGRSLQILVRE